MKYVREAGDPFSRLVVAELRNVIEFATSWISFRKKISDHDCEEYA